jgi:hypothetical protein
VVGVSANQIGSEVERTSKTLTGYHHSKCIFKLYPLKHLHNRAKLGVIATGIACGSSLVLSGISGRDGERQSDFTALSYIVDQ